MNLPLSLIFLFFFGVFSCVWSDWKSFFCLKSHHITSQPPPHFRFLSEVMEAVEVNDLDLVWQHLRDTGEGFKGFNLAGEW